MEPQQMETLLSKVSDVIDSKLASLEVKITKQQKQQHEQQMCKIQEVSDKTFVFKRKGNEAQFKFNNTVREKMVQANTHINDGDAESAFHSITEGIELIDNRQKLVKLADSSKNGWRTVQEYTQHELAENEEDEKRIFKAELRAERKMKEERVQKARIQRRASPIQQTRTNQHRRDQINLTATRSQGHVISVVIPGIGHGIAAAKRKQR